MVKETLAIADAAPFPPDMPDHYEGAHTHRVVKFLREMQRAHGDSPFPLSITIATDVMGFRDRRRTSLYLNMLTIDRVIARVDRHKGKTPARYRYLLAV